MKDFGRMVVVFVKHMMAILLSLMLLTYTPLIDIVNNVSYYANSITAFIVMMVMITFLFESIVEIWDCIQYLVISFVSDIVKDF